MFERSSRHAAPVSMVLYTRADCPLCEEMEAEIARALRPDRYSLRKVDIGSDLALEERFGHSIPVLEIHGEVAFEGRLTAPALLGRLDGRPGPSI